MSNIWRIIGFMLILAVLQACATPYTEEESQNNRTNNSPFLNLSTEGQQNQIENLEQPNMNLMKQEQIENPTIEESPAKPDQNENPSIEEFPEDEQQQEGTDIEPPEQEQPNVDNKPQETPQKTPPIEQPSEQQPSAEIEQVPNQHESMQQKLPEENVGETLVPEEVQEDNNKVVQASTKTTNLPFDNFKQRWNAISEERYSNLIIKSLEKTDSYYQASLTKNIDLRVYVHDNYISQLELLSRVYNPDDIYQMLTGWEQIINIMHPNMEINDVDEFFNLIGVGPNADLSNVKKTEFPYYQLYYEVDPTDEGYYFRVKPQEATQEGNE